jgi:hypothetical protein
MDATPTTIVSVPASTVMPAVVLAVKSQMAGIGPVTRSVANDKARYRGRGCWRLYHNGGNWIGFV